MTYQSEIEHLGWMKIQEGLFQLSGMVVCVPELPGPLLNGVGHE